jgi:hypothetical protein
MKQAYATGFFSPLMCRLGQHLVVRQAVAANAALHLQTICQFNLGSQQQWPTNIRQVCGTAAEAMHDAPSTCNALCSVFPQAYVHPQTRLQTLPVTGTRSPRL